MKEICYLLCFNFVTRRGKLGELSEENIPQGKSNMERKVKRKRRSKVQV